MSTPLSPEFGVRDFAFSGRSGQRIPPFAKPPSYRHGSPSGPWPWLDLNDPVDLTQAVLKPRQPQDLDDWKKYPKSLFPNWSDFQQQKSGIKGVINQRKFKTACTVFRLDITEDAVFHYDDDKGEDNAMPWEWSIHDRIHYYDADGRQVLWKDLNLVPPADTRVRALFVHHLAGPVLQMLGTKYNIEPFYWSSSIKCIPARFQSQPIAGIGDHITIILPYIRTLPNPQVTAPNTPQSSFISLDQTVDYVQERTIDTQGPLVLYYSPARILVPDLLALHVIRRSPESGELSTIVSYHPPSEHPYRKTTAEGLHGRLFAAGQSVYWNKIFSKTVPEGDPTFVTLALLWYAMYAWDEALEELVGEVSALESQTLLTLTSHDLTHNLTHHLHLVRAHLLHYEGLLEHFRKSVFFLVRCSPHPGAEKNTPSHSRSASNQVTPTPPFKSTGKHRRMSILDADRPLHSATADEDEIESLAEGISPITNDPDEDARVGDGDDNNGVDGEESLPEPEDESTEFEKLLNKEATNLVQEIERLQMTRNMLDKRLGNVMGLAFSSVNIEDSRRMSKLTETTVRDSAAMKQLAYLTMFYLPASFVAAVFGMNIPELVSGGNGSLKYYVAAALSLTVFTVWVVMIQYRRTKDRAQRNSEQEQPLEIVGQTAWLSTPFEKVRWRLWPGWRKWVPFFGRGRRRRRLSEKDFSSEAGTRASSRSRRASRANTMNGTGHGDIRSASP